MNAYTMTFKDAPEERQTNAKAIANQLQGKVYVGGKNLWDNFTEICKLSYNKGFVFTEDDIHISNKFSFMPNDNLSSIIHFYFPVHPKNETNPDKLVSSPFDALYKIPGNRYLYNQLVFFPSWFSKVVVDNYDKIKARYKGSYEANLSDVMIARILEELNVDFLATGLTMCKQLNYQTTLSHNNPFYQEKNYIGDFEDGE